jgi:hypothetical protein
MAASTFATAQRTMATRGPGPSIRLSSTCMSEATSK